MKKVVIIGGGFVGSTVAKKLEKKFNVTLIDSKTFFEFTPSILKVIVNPNYKTKIQINHKDYLKKSKIIIGCAKKISKKYVFLEKEKINYNYLVICSGSSYSLPIKESNVSLPSRLTHLEKSENKLKNSKKVVIVGGGIVAVELAGEIATCKRKRNIEIYTRGNKLIKRNNFKSSMFSKEFLEKKGVKIFFNSKIKINKKGIFKNNKKINADIFFLAVGIKNNTKFIDKNMNILNKKGQVIVNKYLLAGRYKNIFAGGDITSIKEEKLAQNAETHGKIIAKNIIRSEKKENLKEYISTKRLMLISLGKKIGIFEYKKYTFIGILPLIMKNIIEKIHLKKI